MNELKLGEIGEIQDGLPHYRGLLVVKCYNCGGYITLLGKRFLWSSCR